MSTSRSKRRATRIDFAPVGKGKDLLNHDRGSAMHCGIYSLRLKANSARSTT